MKSALIGMLLFGILLFLGPIGAGMSHTELPGGTGFLMLAFGAVLVLISGTALVVTQLYMRARPDMALVRTGAGGSKVIQNGGILVLPVIHEVVEVSLASMRLQIIREAKDALLTLDKLRANVRAEFYVHVDSSKEGLEAAARSLGSKSSNDQAVMTLVEDKLVNALRSVAAKMTLEDLNTERDKFVKDVMDHLTKDLAPNGLKLESVTISHLDQAPHTSLDENNVFDAQGLRTIAEKVQEQLTKKNQLVRDGERLRLQQDVTKRQAELDLQKQQAEAEAKQRAEVAQIQATSDQAAKQAAIRAEQQVQASMIEKEQALAIRTQEKEQAQRVAEQEKEKMVALAEKIKEKEVSVAAQNAARDKELAGRAREIAIAEQSTKLAEAEQKHLEAEKARVATEQAVQTVQTVEQAKREQQKAVIAADGIAQQALVKTQREADGEAYRLKATADGKKAAADADAEAIRKRAMAEADATRLRAEGESNAAKLRAEGEQATSVVPINIRKLEVDVQRAAAEIPVDVARKQVDVDQARIAVKQKEVDVLTQELKARTESGAVAQDFELSKLRIQMEGQVRIETAKAMATFGQKFEGTFVGTPDQLAQMQQSIFKGMGYSMFAESALAHMGPETKAVVSAVGALAADAAAALAGKKEAPKNGEA